MCRGWSRMEGDEFWNELLSRMNGTSFVEGRGRGYL